MKVTSRSGACHSKYSRTSSISSSVACNMNGSRDELVAPLQRVCEGLNNSPMSLSLQNPARQRGMSLCSKLSFANSLVAPAAPNSTA